MTKNLQVDSPMSLAEIILKYLLTNMPPDILPHNTQIKH